MRSAGAPCGSDKACAAPVSDALAGSFGSGTNERVLVGSEPDGAVDGARVVTGWPASAWCHDDDYSGNGKSLTGQTLATTISDMTSPALNPPRLGDPINNDDAYRTRKSADTQAALWNEELAGDPIFGRASGLRVGVAPRSVGGRFQLVWVSA